jgi:phosphoribosylanthranilate isomerase
MMGSTRIKICGITRDEDVDAAVNAGADAIGLVFYPKSPRAVSLDQAERLARRVPPFVTVVGLFVDAQASDIESVLRRVPLGLLQFHGDESPEFCAQFCNPWIKALRMHPKASLEKSCESYASAQGILLDAWKEGVPGGTGETFDWSRVAQDLPLPVVLAGGLNSGNVGAAIAQVQPAAVDVSGGVESAPGIKSAVKIQEFVTAARAVP